MHLHCLKCFVVEQSTHENQLAMQVIDEVIEKTGKLVEVEAEVH